VPRERLGLATPAPSPFLSPIQTGFCQLLSEACWQNRPTCPSDAGFERRFDLAYLARQKRVVILERFERGSKVSADPNALYPPYLADECRHDRQSRGDTAENVDHVRAVPKSGTKSGGLRLHGQTRCSDLLARLLQGRQDSNLQPPVLEV
jgi:hypothetical protein